MAVCRIIFMGTPAFAVPALSALTERPDLCEVVAVVTQPDRPAGRGRKVVAGPVKTAALARGIAALSPTKLKAPETHALLAELRPDLAVVAAYGRILPPAILELPRLGCINIHASLLPRYRGASPIAHAIAAGDAESGVGIMRMDAGLDTGPVFAMQALPITENDTCGSLTIRLAELGAALLMQTLPSILDGSCVARPQDDAAATYAPLLRKEDGALDFAKGAEILARQVRAFYPWPGAFVWHGGSRLSILKAHAVANQPKVPAGTVLQADGRGLLVACAQGCLQLDEVKPEGRNVMPAAAFVAGRGLTVGASLSAVAPVAVPDSASD